jgi:hypothetical protein
MKRLTNTGKKTRWADIDIENAKVYRKLAEYENTGLEPSEVILLQKENTDLKMQITRLETDLENQTAYELKASHEYTIKTLQNANKDLKAQISKQEAEQKLKELKE